MGDSSAYMAPIMDNCTRRCKVSLGSVNDTQETGGEQTRQTGTTSAGTQGRTTMDLTVIRDCRRTGGMLDPASVWYCPFDPAAGEIVVPIGGYECACDSDGFAQAASGMTWIKNMTEDLSCTSP